MSLKGKTLFNSGGSRGIGLAIALRAAADGANVVIAAKTAEPNPKLAGTIHSAAREIEQAGGACLPVQTDIRDEAQVLEAAHAILCSDPRTTSGNFFLDEDVLRAAGVSDFDPYAVVPGTRELLPDLFV